MKRVEYGEDGWDGVPHLGLWMGDGTITPIPVGAVVYVIEDPRRADKTMPLILTKVSLKAFDFICACGNPECTRKLRYRAEKAGHHPPMSSRYSTPKEEP